MLGAKNTIVIPTIHFMSIITVLVFFTIVFTLPALAAGALFSCVCLRRVMAASGESSEGVLKRAKCCGRKSVRVYGCYVFLQGVYT